MNLLASLAVAGIIERAGPRRSVLRVTPRFLAHAERAAADVTDAQVLLQDALATWDGYELDPRLGATVLSGILSERGQWGLLRSPFAAGA